jgi:hypothetical protein
MHHQLRATGTHLSLIAHITPRELTQTFQRDQAHNGFANRCLWTWVERSNCLSSGGSAPAEELSAIAGTLRSAVAWATARPQILFRRDQEAEELWADCYESLSYRDPGLRGAATSRGEAQVLRLSALYAALDCSDQIGRLFYSHVNGERIDAALEQLAAFGALANSTEQTGGRRSTLWLAVQH